jgi:hypothetical protein
VNLNLHSYFPFMQEVFALNKLFKNAICNVVNKIGFLESSNSS